MTGYNRREIGIKVRETEVPGEKAETEHKMSHVQNIQ